MTAARRRNREARSGVRKAHGDRAAVLCAERRALRATDQRAEVERAHRRLERLYDVSKVLTRFETVDQTLPELLGIVSAAVPLRMAVLVLGQGSSPAKTHVFAWHAEGIDESRVRGAKVHAVDAYADLSRPYRGVRPARVDFDDEAPSSLFPASSAAAAEAPDDDGPWFVVLPLVVCRGRVFGALQVEGAGCLDEEDLSFVNACVNQLAIAFDRQAAVEARQAEAESRRTAAEEARAQALALLAFTRAVTESLGEGVLATDLEGGIIFANPAARRMLGIVGEELGERAIDVLRIQRLDGTAVSDAAHPLGQVIRSGGPIRCDEHLFSGAVGASFPVRYTAAPLRQGGEITGAVLVFEDILELRRSEQRQWFLSEAGALFASSLDLRETLSAVVRATVPLLGDVCLIDELDETGRATRFDVVFADPAKQPLAEEVKAFAPSQGWGTPQAMVLRSGKSLFLPDFAAEPLAQDPAHAEVMKRIGIRSMMVVPLQARGRILGALTFVMAESGRRFAPSDLAFAEEVGRRAAVAIDNARLYQQAQRATQSREDLLAVVSHDLRNLLGTIFTSTGVLLARAAAETSGAPARRGLDTIQRSAERMKRLLDDLVDLGSIEAGHLAVVKSWDPAAALLEEAAEQHRSAAAQKGLRLEVDVPAHRWEVCCDRERILQVFGNLIGNAIKFVSRGGLVRVRGTRHGSAALFSVEDTGPGIPSEDLAHVFDRYWQAGKTARLGAGLGLAIAKGMVEAHGGTIRAESRLGVGTTFLFTLPDVRDTQREPDTDIVG